MKIHTRHVTIVSLIILILLLVATVAARAQDFSRYSGAQLPEAQTGAMISRLTEYPRSIQKE